MEEKCDHYDVDAWEYQEENNIGQIEYTSHCNDCDKDVRKYVTTEIKEEIELDE